jgi:hypothetical protein
LLKEGESVTQTFTVKVTDEFGASDTETVTITINGTNDVPVANPDTIYVSDNTTGVVLPASWLLGNDTDPEKTTTTILSVSESSPNIVDGTLLLTTSGGTQTVSFTTQNIPDSGMNSQPSGATTTTSFAYVIQDANGATSTGTVNLIVANYTNGADSSFKLNGDGYQGSYLNAQGDNDTVITGAAPDILIGAGGSDFLNGGGGNDVLSGGAATDMFAFGAPGTTGKDIITDFATSGQPDIVALLQGGGGWNAATTTPAAGNTSSLAAADYVQTRAAIANITAAETNKVVELSSAQTTEQITTGIGGAANAYVLVFNSTTGKGELWWDDDWSTAAGEGESRTQLATFDNITTLGGVTAFSNGNFAEWVPL